MSNFTGNGSLVRNGIIFGGSHDTEAVHWSEATTSVKKNLLKNKATTTTINGVTFTVNSDGSVTANGTATALAVFDVVNTQLYSWKPKFSAGSYKLSCENVVAGTSYFALTVIKGGTTYYDYLRVPEGTSEVTWTDADISDITDYFFGLVIQSGQTVNNVTFYPMFRLASIADATYEPYIPDNTELMQYTDNAVLGAKNRLPNNATSQTINGVTLTKNADGTITANGTATSAGFEYVVHNYQLKAGTYKISKGEPTDITIQLVLDDMSNNRIATLVQDREITFTLSVDTYVKCYIWFSESAVFNNYIYKPMIRLSTDTDDTYAPYAMTNREMTPYVQAISNPNLLDNPWFTINQRGQSSYTTDNAYNFDRWKLYTNGATDCSVARSDDVVTLTKGAGYFAILAQLIPDDLSSSFVGKVATMSLLLSNGDILSGTSVIKSGENTVFYTEGGTRIDLQNPTAVTGASYAVRIHNTSSTPLQFKAIKLELGSISTLHLDSVPNYATELLKCQRYYLSLGSSIVECLGIGQAVGADDVRVHIPVPVKMRTTPSVSVNDISKIFIRNASNYITPSALLFDSTGNTELVLRFTVLGATAGAVYEAFTNTDGVISLTADL